MTKRDNQAHPYASAVHLSQSRPERRKLRRARLSLLVRLGPANSKDGNFDQVLETLNSTRRGFYFTTNSKSFYRRMPLRVVFPYAATYDPVPASEDYGEVVRLDTLPDGQLGVAVQIRGKSPVEQPIFETAPKEHRIPETGERRITERQPFSAMALVVDSSSGARLQARCSDLNGAGCYLDTINPFPDGTRVQLQLTCGDEVFETAARVAFSQVGMGMGLVFSEPSFDQELVVLRWLNGGLPQPIPSPEQPAAARAPESQETTLALRLIRLLRSKGMLTEADVSVLLSKHRVTDDELACRPCNDRL